MDEASRMARAREMGSYAEMPLAHGSAAEFDAFNSAKFGSTTGAAPARLGVWTEVRQGRSAPIADRFARLAAKSTGGNPQVYPLIHRTANPAQLTLRGDETRREIVATLADAWDRGHDAVLMKNHYSTHGGAPGSILVVKDPSQLRSPFAAFDPAKRDSAKGISELDPEPAVRRGAMICQHSKDSDGGRRSSAPRKMFEAAYL